MKPYDLIVTTPRILMGPGPSNVHPRVLKAMATPLVGHLDPEFLAIMDQTQAMLRDLFGTANALTIPVSGTGSSGMEAALCNVLEPGDDAVVCVNGVFGERMSDIVQRCGANLHRVESPWGQIIDPEDVKRGMEVGRPKVVAIVHAETSTGVLQPLREIGQIVRERDALFLVDTVTSLAGTHVGVDEHLIDICYSGTQKCLSCPPGLAPVTFGPRAVEAIHRRKTKVQSWYLDMTMIERYWGEDRAYHHTAPISMAYAFNEALHIILEEGLEARYARHERHSNALKAGLTAMGLDLLAQEGYRAPMLTTVSIPEGVEDGAIRKRLLQEYRLELGGGLGDFKGRAWRVGLMGESCTQSNVFLLLSALERLLNEAGHPIQPGVALGAAAEAYR